MSREHALYSLLVLLAAVLAALPFDQKMRDAGREAQTYLGLSPEFWANTFRQISEPGGGSYVLPDPVTAAIRGIEALGLKEYDATGRFAENAYLNQKIHEGAWPVRPSRSSRHKIGFAEDLAATPGCETVWSDQGVAIARCGD